jgi:hypothetical protein
VRIPAKRTPFFKVGKELKERIDAAWRATGGANNNESGSGGGFSGSV